MDHRLMGQLATSDATDEEIFELFEDLQMVYSNPFDKVLAEVMQSRSIMYVEQLQTLPN